jgi:hypothetical protein
MFHKLSPNWNVVAQVGAAILLHRVSMDVLLHRTGLEESAFFSWALTPQIITRPWSVLFLVANLAIATRYCRRIDWSSFDDRQLTRMFVFVLSGIFAWQFSTYGYNFYYDRSHGIDRALLVALWLLTWRHPLFLGPFLIELVLIFSQLQFPFPGYRSLWTDKRMVFDLLVLINSIALLRCFLPPIRWLHWYLSLCLVGNFYFDAAVAKCSVGDSIASWLLENRLGNLFVSSYVFGWLSWIGESTILRWAFHIPGLDAGGRAYTLLIEFLGIAILIFGRRCALLILAGCILLHVAIFASSGILFWIWIVADGMLLVVLWRIKPDAELFAWRWRLASLWIIASGVLNPFPLKFGWYDSRVADQFSVHGENSTGESRRIHPHEFAPYDMTFGFGRFGMLTPSKTLVGTYGTTHDVTLFRQLETASAANIGGIYEQFGVDRFDQVSAHRFVFAVQRFLRNKRRGAPPVFAIIDRIAAPHHFWGTVPGSGGLDIEDLRGVDIFYDSYLHGSDTINHWRSELVMSIPLSDSRTIPTSLETDADPE